MGTDLFLANWQALDREDKSLPFSVEMAFD